MASQIVEGTERQLPVASGLIRMVAGVALLTIMDGCIKVLLAGMAVPEAMFFRCVLALPILLVALRWDGGFAGLRNARAGVQLLRGLFVFLTGFAFFTALQGMPLADVLVIGFAAPFLIAILSGPLLGEPVARRQWVVIALGFGGVVLAVQPGAEGFIKPGAAWALLAATAYALNSIVLRRLGRSDTASVTAIWGTVMPAMLYGLAALPVWTTPAAADVPILLLAGVLGAAGTLAINSAFRLAPAATLAPLEYTALVWAVLIGVLVFGDVPGWPVILGSCLIIASGMVLARQRR